MRFYSNETMFPPKNISRPSLLIVLCALAVLIVMVNGRAALVFQLDATTQEFFLTGSDSGTPIAGTQNGRVWWTAGVPLVGVSQTLDLETGVTATDGISPFESTVFLAQALGGGGTPGFSIRVATETTDSQTLRGTGVRVSYAGLSPSHRDQLEQLVARGGQFAVALGGGFSPISTRFAGGDGGDELVTVDVTGPERRVTGAARTVVRGTAAADLGVAEVRVKRKGGRFRAVRGTTAWRFGLKLDPGRNVVRIMAVDSVGNRSAKVRVVVIRR